MNSKGHFWFSIVKSLFRVFGCIISILTKNMYALCVFFLFAEILGVLEEFVDKRD